ncbi:hypothetical protein ACIBH1_11255 [Nonomuraea sp. NPDC050663]|uniref:hypothetical protein n=1 Tax=Nonomuraea sp. NPDC050663 TaxID=3364370 RepID=UPI00378928D9
MISPNGGTAGWGDGGAVETEESDDDLDEEERSVLSLIKAMPGHVSLDSMLTEIRKLNAIRAPPLTNPGGGPHHRGRDRQCRPGQGSIAAGESWCTGTSNVRPTARCVSIWPPG